MRTAKNTLIRLATTILLLICVTALIPTVSDSEKVYAKSSHTQTEAVNWIKARKAEKWARDYDGAYGPQCVDLIVYYCVWLEGYRPSGMAYDYVNRRDLPSGWSYVSSPQAGDIAVWGANVGIALWTGHVALVESVGNGTFSYVDVNGTTGQAGSGNISISNPSTFIRPGYATPTPTVPTGKEMTSGYDRVIPDGDYIIANSRHTDSKNSRFYFLDIQGNGKPAANSTNVFLWDEPADAIPECDIWTVSYKDGFYTIKQKGTDMALDVAGGKYERGTNVQVYKSNNGDSQKWAISWVKNGDEYVGFRVQSKRNSWFLDVYNASKERRTNVQLWEKNSNSSAAQIWEFIPYKPAQPVEEGRYVLVSALDPYLTMDVRGESAEVANNTNVQVWHDYEGDNVQSRFNSFDIRKLSNGYYSIIHAASGKSLDVRGGFSNAATWRYANVEIYAKHGGLNQQFAITKADNGYMLTPRCSGLPLDVANGKTDNGTNVRQTQYWGQDNKAQSWYFVSAEYTVSYDANGGAGAPATQIKYYRDNLTLSNVMPTKAGYTFKGWSTDKASVNPSYYPGNVYSSDANLTLYAVWESVQLPTPTTPGSNPNQNGSDGTPVETGASAASAERAITSSTSEEGPKGTKFGLLALRSSKQTKNSIKLTWNGVGGAKKYVIYGNACGKKNKLKKIATVKGKTYNVKKAGKVLKKGTYYKFMVVALDENNTVKSASKVAHIATKGGKGGNHMKVTVKKTKVALKKGKTFKIGAKQTGKNVKVHRGIAYETTNAKVATVTKGKIVAKGKGACYVYVYAQNGLYKRIKVTVS